MYLCVSKKRPIQYLCVICDTDVLQAVWSKLSHHFFKDDIFRLIILDSRFNRVFRKD